MQYCDPSKRARANRADCIVRFRIPEFKVAEPWFRFNYQHLRQFSKTSPSKQKLPRKFIDDLQELFTQLRTPRQECQIDICDFYGTPIEFLRWVQPAIRSPKHLARKLLAEVNSIPRGDFIPITIYPADETDGLTGYRPALMEKISMMETYDHTLYENIVIDAWMIGIGWRTFAYTMAGGQLRGELTVDEVLDLHDYYACGDISRCKKAVAKCFRAHGKPFEKGILDIIALYAGPEVVEIERDDLTVTSTDFSRIGGDLLFDISYDPDEDWETDGE